MQQYIAILRGINVGGNRKILMVDLKNLFKKLGFANVTTYIQSGNVIFEANEKDQKVIAEKISNAILEQYGFEVPTVVITYKELAEAIKLNPFYKKDVDIDRLHLTFLKEVPSQVIFEGDYKKDKFKISGKNAFIYCDGKYHESKLTNTFFEKRLQISATTRNWKTVLKLAELASA